MVTWSRKSGLLCRLASDRGIEVVRWLTMLSPARTSQFTGLWYSHFMVKMREGLSATIVLRKQLDIIDPNLKKKLKAKFFAIVIFHFPRHYEHYQARNFYIMLQIFYEMPLNLSNI